MSYVILLVDITSYAADRFVLTALILGRADVTDTGQILIVSAEIALAKFFDAIVLHVRWKLVSFLFPLTPGSFLSYQARWRRDCIAKTQGSSIVRYWCIKQ